MQFKVRYLLAEKVHLMEGGEVARKHPPGRGTGRCQGPEAGNMPRLCVEPKGSHSQVSKGSWVIADEVKKHLQPAQRCGAERGGMRTDSDVPCG